MKRRDFIANTSLAGLGLASTPLMTSCMQAEPKSKLKEIGFQVYTVREQVTENLEPTLEQLAKTGYTYAEVYSLQGNTVMGKPVKEVIQAFANTGIEIRSTHTMTGQGQDVSGTMSNNWQEAVDSAAEMGVKNVVCAYLLENERQTLDDYKRVAELLNTCGEVSQKAGIHMGYHNHEFEFEQIDSQTPMFILLDETDPNLVKLELDLYWAVYAEQNISSFFQKYSGRINQWHVKEMSKTSKDMTEVGKGRIDWPAIFAESELSGMQNCYVEQDGNWTDSDIQSLKDSYTFLSQMEY